MDDFTASTARPGCRERLGLPEVGVASAGVGVASAGVGVASAAVVKRLGMTAFEVVPGAPAR